MSELFGDLAFLVTVFVLFLIQPSTLLFVNASTRHARNSRACRGWTGVSATAVWLTMHLSVFGVHTTFGAGGCSWYRVSAG